MVVEDEIVSRRTSRSKTFRLSNGSRLTKVFLEPLHFRGRDDGWEAIDNRLVADGPDAFVNAANDVRVRVPRSLEDAVRVEHDGAWVAMGLRGASGSAEVSGAEARFAGALEGVDVVHRAVESGLKEELTLERAKPLAEFVYDLEVRPGLRPRLSESAGVEIVDGQGSLRLVIPRAFMWDSADTPAVSDEVEYALERADGDGWRLKVRPDAVWLASPDRKWPVVVDPSVTKASASLDCSIGSDWSTNQCGSAGYGTMHVEDSPAVCGDGGTTSATSSLGLTSTASSIPSTCIKEYRRRALMRFDLSFLTTRAVINRANLGLVSNYGALTSRPLHAYRVTRGWDANVSWSRATANTLWSTSGGDLAASSAPSLASRPASGGLMSFDLTLLTRDWADQPASNHGLMLTTNENLPTCFSSCSSDYQSWYSATYSDTTKRPYLEVNWDPATGPGNLLSYPRDGDITGRKIIVKGQTVDAGITGVRFQYVAPNESVPPASRPWREVPVGALRDEQGGAVTYPLPVSGGKTQAYTWDLQATPGMETDGPVHVRALYEGSGGGVSEHVNLRLDRRDLDSAASEPIGPGAVNLLTGDFTMSSADVSIDSHRVDLTLSRTYHSRGTNARTADLFGPGWQSSVELDEATMPYRSLYNFREYEQDDIPYDPEDPEAGFETVIWETEYTVLEDADGATTSFRYEDGKWVAEDEANDLALTKDDVGTFRLTDTDGNVTIFKREDAAATTPDSPLYRPTEYREAGSKTATTYEYMIVGGKRRLWRVRAPEAPGVSCTGNPEGTRGCRSLRFDFVSISTPSGAKDRLQAVHFFAWEGGAMVDREVVRYEYDGEARLIGVYDPRISPALKTTYSYDAQGRLVTVMPPGEEPWSLNYTSRPGDNSTARLKSVTRSSLDGGSAVTTAAYDVPVAGSGAPYDLSATSVARWGQQDLPVYATAIFPPDQVPADPPTSYTRATVAYMNHRGATVNEVQPGGHISTSERDKFGNVSRELTAANRARALSATDPAARSRELDTQRKYSADGLDLLETLGPLHVIRLKSGENVWARAKTTTVYDEGKPASITGPAHLPTTVTVAAQIAGRADQEPRVTSYRYSDASGDRGWEMRQPTQTVIDAVSGGLNLTSSVRFHATEPLVIETRTPAGNAGGGDVNATKTIHYTADGAAEDASCRNKPEWHGLACKTLPLAQPSSTTGLPSLPVTTYQYNSLNQVTSEADAVGATTRTTLTGFDRAGRPVRQEVKGGAGTGVSGWISTTYDSATGRLSLVEHWTEEEYECSPGVSCIRPVRIGSTNRTYDRLGRPTGYTDNTGQTSTTSYDKLDRPATTNDGKGTQTYTYDATRGLLTTLADSAAGTFTASYDADGAMTRQNLPGGLSQFTPRDETGAPIRRYYQKMTICTTACVWFDTRIRENVHGQWVLQEGTLSNQTLAYDQAGRLTSVKDTPAGQGCTTRLYGYDADSNRTSLTTKAPTSTGACATTDPGTTKTSSYDQADRILGTGYSYDTFGRITKVPAGDAGGHDLTSAYYVDDRAHQHTQNGVTRRYHLDPLRRVSTRETITTTTVSDQYHYAGDGDEPTWITEGAGWTRYISGIDGDLVATHKNTGEIKLQIANLHDDIIAESTTDPMATGLSTSFETDEFGIPRQTGARRYGWIGSKQRSTELTSGLIQMGVRSYLPQLGRFLQTDPVQGGSCNAYEYACQDPINKFDLDGLSVKDGPDLGRHGVHPCAYQVYWDRVPRRCRNKTGARFWQAVAGIVTGLASRGKGRGGGKQAGSPAALSRAELEAVRRKSQGLPYDEKAFVRAQQKKKQAEKYRGDRRNRQKDR